MPKKVHDPPVTGPVKHVQPAGGEFLEPFPLKLLGDWITLVLNINAVPRHVEARAFVIEEDFACSVQRVLCHGLQLSRLNGCCQLRGLIMAPQRHGLAQRPTGPLAFTCSVDGVRGCQ